LEVVGLSILTWATFQYVDETIRSESGEEETRRCDLRIKDVWSRPRSAYLVHHCHRDLTLAMSLSSTSAIKSQLRTALGLRAPGYFDVFQQFVAGKISRTEFDDSIRKCLDAPNLGM